jgi:hypothetical protein
VKRITWKELTRRSDDAARDDVDAAHDAALALNMDLWDCDGSEDDLRHETPEEAIGDYLDQCAPGDEPEQLDVAGYQRMTIKPNAWELDPGRLLENLYESLDDEYNSGEDPSEPTAAVKAAAQAFLDVVRREYVAYNCDQRVIVSLDAADVAAFVAEQWPSR